jgi:hypothetical protein
LYSTYVMYYLESRVKESSDFLVTSDIPHTSTCWCMAITSPPPSTTSI